MGGEQSQGFTGNLEVINPDCYRPLGAQRTKKEKDGPINHIDTQKLHFGTSILKTAFTAPWSLIIPNSITPSPRIGHFYSHDKEHRCVYMGYGISPSGTYLADMWQLDLEKKEWTSFRLNGNVPCPRQGAEAVKCGDILVLFGGLAENQYFDDLYTINLSTGECNQQQSIGEKPFPRSNPYMAYYNNKIFVFGGFNGTFLCDLYVLDINTVTWRYIDPGIYWRCDVPYTVVDGILYSYGGTKGTDLLTINLSTEAIAVTPTTGAAPVNPPTEGGLVSAEGYIFCFGGKNKSHWTLVYGMDIEKNWWFVFYVAPDGATTTAADGKTSESGIFMLPSVYGFGSVYDEQSREIVAFMGIPYHDPSPLQVVGIGEALPILGLRKDMITMLHC